MKVQFPTDAQALAFLNDWPDGTPKSFGNGFTLHWHAVPAPVVRIRKVPKDE